MEQIDVDPADARRRLEDAGAMVSEDGGGWRARLGGSVVRDRGNAVSVEGNVDRVREVVEGGGSATVYFDGASRGNPGPAAAAYVVEDPDGVVVEDAREIGEATNNEAEYAALLDAVTEARELGYVDVEAVGDSQLVVEQVRGNWRCKADNLRPLLQQVKDVVDGFDGFEIRHVPREMNERADELANEVLDG